jgi:hypothetical protein
MLRIIKNTLIDFSSVTLTYSRTAAALFNPPEVAVDYLLANIDIELYAV